MERDLIHENAPPSSSSFSPFISNLRNSQIQQVLVQQWIRSCQKEEPLSGSLRLINMVAVCVWGQMSNRLICLEKHMLFAALLNRRAATVGTIAVAAVVRLRRKERNPMA
ncbi:hypothetical protein JHK87_054669 [Glycine soja]|nr:hypothetical protein JHK87_054669 [Glycine soja]